MKRINETKKECIEWPVQGAGVICQLEKNHNFQQLCFGWRKVLCLSGTQVCRDIAPAGVIAPATPM